MESEINYKKLFENANVGIFRSKIDGSQILDVNRKMCEITGFTKDELLQSNSFIRWANTEKRDEMVQLLKENGQISDFEMEGFTKNDTKIICLLSIHLYPEQGYMDGTVVDITESKKTERDLLLKNTIIETSSIGIAIRDLKGNLEYANREFYQMWGYAKEECQSISVSEFWEYPEQMAASMKSLISDGNYKGEMTARRKDGTTFICQIYGNTVKDENGNIIAFAASFADITEKKSLESKWYTLIKNAPDIITHLDSNDNILSINRLEFNMKEEDIISKSIYDFILPEHHEIAKKSLMQARETGKPAAYEVQSGERFEDIAWYRTTVSPIITNEEETELIAIASNITDRKKAEIALAEEKERLSVTLASIGDAVIATDTEGKITLLNKVAEELTSWKQNEAVGKPITEIFNIVNENTGKTVESPVDKVLEEGLVVGLANHTILISKNGEEIPIEDSGAPIKNSNGSIIGVVLVFRDAREKREAEKERLKLITDKAKILEVAIDGIGTADLKMRIKEVNAAFLKMFEYEDNDDIAGKPVLELFTESERKIMMERSREDIEKGISRTSVYTGVTKQGREFPAMISVSLKKDESGNPEEFVAVIRDISDFREAEKKMQEAREKAMRAEKLAVIGQLSSSIAHELRNPLGSIKNAQYYIKSKLKEILDPEKHKLEFKFLDGIEEEVNRSNHIITDLLSFSHQRKLKIKKAPIQPVIDGILNSISIPESIKVECSYSHNEDFLIDPDQLDYALKNLIINAIQSMDDTGVLSIRTAIVPGADKEYAEISIQDTGCGIPDNIRDTMFEPLVSTKTKGTGLGLSIVKNIIDAHEGEIVIGNNKDQGTVFTVLLPMEEAEQTDER